MFVLWTDDQVARLKQLIADGLSTSQIAAELGGGLSRNAVIGKINRMGLNSSLKRTRGRQHLAGPAVKPSTAPVGSTAFKVIRAIKAKHNGSDAPPVQLPSMKDDGATVPRHVALIDLKANECRWPYGDGPFTFCGCRRLEGLPYCAPHARRSSAGLPVRRRAA